MNHIVFDLDGTLVDSLPGIALALNRALESLEKPVHTTQHIRTLVGRGARRLCADALPADEQNLPASIDALLQAFMREYPHTWQQGTVPYEGIPAMLERLAADGNRLAVLSNKPHIVTAPLVKHLFPAIPFAPVMGYTPQYPRKPDPSSLLHIAATWKTAPSAITMVGDSLHDAHTAQNAGTALTLVSWGYALTDDLLTTGAPLCTTIAELERSLRAGTGIWG